MADAGQPGKLKVFISYSRADEAFADELRLGLEDKGYAVEIDKHSIRQGEEWKARLSKLIAACDTVVFVLSPDSARSPVCHWEVDEAHNNAKRIVPVLHRGLHEPPKGEQPDGTQKVPQRLPSGSALSTTRASMRAARSWWASGASCRRWRTISTASRHTAGLLPVHAAGASAAGRPTD